MYKQPCKAHLCLNRNIHVNVILRSKLVIIQVYFVLDREKSVDTGGKKIRGLQNMNKGVFMVLKY